MLTLNHRGICIYFRKNITKSMRKAILDPLTTSIWVMPLWRNACFTFVSRKSSIPITIPRSTHETSFGNHFWNVPRDDSRSFSNSVGVFFQICSKSGRNTVPYPHSANAYRLYPCKGGRIISEIFPVNEITSPSCM